MTRAQNRNVVISTDWKYVSEPSPAFQRLMMLLLSPRWCKSAYAAKTSKYDEKGGHGLCQGD